MTLLYMEEWLVYIFNQTFAQIDLFLDSQLPFTSKSHCMVGVNETFYLLLGGERGDYSKYVDN